MHIEAYGGQSIHSLGSCVLHLHIDNKVFPTVFEVTNTPGPIILGRVQAKAMGYVQFPQIGGHILSTRLNMLLQNSGQPGHQIPRLQRLYIKSEHQYTRPSKERSPKRSKPNRLQNQYYQASNGVQTT